MELVSASGAEALSAGQAVRLRELKAIYSTVIPNQKEKQRCGGLTVPAGTSTEHSRFGVPGVVSIDAQKASGPQDLPRGRVQWGKN